MGSKNDFGIKESDLFPEDDNGSIHNKSQKTEPGSEESFFQEDLGKSEGNLKKWIGFCSALALVVSLVLIFLLMPENSHTVESRQVYNPPTDSAPMKDSVTTQDPDVRNHLELILQSVKHSCCWLFDPNDPKIGQPAIVTSSIGLLLTFMPLEQAGREGMLKMIFPDNSKINIKSTFECEKVFDIEERVGVHFTEFSAKNGGKAEFSVIKIRSDPNSDSGLFILNIYPDTIEILPYSDFKRKGFTAQDQNRWWPAVNDQAELVGCCVPGKTSLDFLTVEEMGLGD